MGDECQVETKPTQLRPILVNMQYLGKMDSPMGSRPLSAATGERDSFHGETYTLVILNVLWRSFYFALTLEGV